MAITGVLGVWIAPPASIAQTATVTYDDLAPILSARCVMCHSGPSAAVGLRLDTAEGVLAGSANGLVVRAGDPQASELIRRLKGASSPRMPMTGPPYLADAEIAMFERWIASGALVAPSAGTSKPAAPPRATLAPPVRATGQPITYADVAPIFATRCAKCHTDNGQMGPAPEGYRLTSYAATISPTDRVRVVPGFPRASELVRRIRGDARPRMPFDGPPFLDEKEITLIEEWIGQGARDALGSPAPVPVGARVRLHGRLGAGWTLDGLRLAVTGGTRIDKSPSEGDYVEVRGTVRRDGSVDVERLRRR